jgi:hypothetical protein
MKLFILAVFALLTFIPIELEKRKFLNDKVEILIPKDFKHMSAEVLDIKYKGKNRPTLVLTNEDATVNIALNILPNPANEDAIESYKNAVKSSFEKAFPVAEWKSDGVKVINGRKVGYLKLITNAADQTVFNSLFITHCEGKLLIGTFNCTEELLPEWQEASEKIVQSLKVL